MKTAKKFLYLALLVTVSISLVELSSYIFLGIYGEELTNLSVKQRNLKYPNGLQNHPLFGHTYPTKLHHINSHGFTTHTPYPYKKNTDEFVIGIFGGSVAQSTYFQLFENWDKYKLNLPDGWKKKKVVLLPFTVRGMRHPQSFIVLSQYVDTIDYAIFLEGVNEITFTLPASYPSSFPPFHNLFNMESSELVRLSYQNHRLASFYTKLVDFKNFDILSSLNFVKTLAVILGRSVQNKIASNLTKYKTEQSKLNNFSEKSHEFQSRMEPRMQMWRTSLKNSISLLNHRKTPYVFYLQPSQYIGPKFLSEWERENAYDRDSEDFRLAYLKAERLYSEFKNQGHTFVSLARIFDNDPNTRFVDSCCHLNEKGTDLLIKSIFAEISDRVE